MRMTMRMTKMMIGQDSDFVAKESGRYKRTLGQSAV